MIPMLQFLEPGRLWWALLVPGVLLLYAALLSRRSARSSQPDGLSLVLPRQDVWKRHVAVLMATLSMTALVLAYARPKGVAEVPRDRATVVLVIDVSKSMLANDIKPTRLEAAKEQGVAFVRKLPPGFNISLVGFAGTANLLVPPTTDKERVVASINALDIRVSTAIGDGIYTGLDALSLVPPDPKGGKDAPPAAMVLLSDGKTNIGRPSRDAAEAAKSMGVPISTIAYGTPTGHINENGRLTRVPPDYAELAEISKISGGERYDARSESDLREIYDGIAHSIGYEKVDKEITGKLIGWGLVAAILAALGVISVAARWP